MKPLTLRNWIVDSVRDVDVYARAVLHSIARHANARTLEAFPAQATIADETGMSERRVRDALRDLTAAGYVIATGRRKVPHGFVTVYRIRPDHRHRVPVVDARPPARRAATRGPTTGTTRRDHRHNTSRPPARRADEVDQEVDQEVDLSTASAAQDSRARARESAVQGTHGSGKRDGRDESEEAIVAELVATFAEHARDTRVADLEAQARAWVEKNRCNVPIGDERRRRFTLWLARAHRVGDVPDVASTAARKPVKVARIAPCPTCRNPEGPCIRGTCPGTHRATDTPTTTTTPAASSAPAQPFDVDAYRARRRRELVAQGMTPDEADALVVAELQRELERQRRARAVAARASPTLGDDMTRALERAQPEQRTRSQ